MVAAAQVGDRLNQRSRIDIEVALSLLPLAFTMRPGVLSEDLSLRFWGRECFYSDLAF
jgi:hypothetical protein